MSTRLAEGLPHTALRDVRDDISVLAYEVGEALVVFAKTTIHTRKFEALDSLVSFINNLGGSHPEFGQPELAISQEDTDALLLMVKLFSAVIHTCRDEAIDGMPATVNVKMDDSASSKSRAFYLTERAIRTQGWSLSVSPNPQGGWNWTVRFSLL